MHCAFNVGGSGLSRSLLIWLFPIVSVEDRGSLPDASLWFIQIISAVFSSACVMSLRNNAKTQKKKELLYEHSRFWVRISNEALYWSCIHKCNMCAAHSPFEMFAWPQRITIFGRWYQTLPNLCNVIAKKLVRAPNILYSSLYNSLLRVTYGSDYHIRLVSKIELPMTGYSRKVLPQRGRTLVRDEELVNYIRTIPNRVFGTAESFPVRHHKQK